MKPSTSAGLGLHTPRLEARKKSLNSVFSQEQMATCWKKYVRSGLRDQEVIDLFDYNDFHWFKEQRFDDLRRAILDGRYKPAYSIPTKLEKKYGVCRTVVTPSPEDAIVLQCIVESLLPKALKKQPSSNAFFSRSHQAPDASFQFGKDYIWFRQWRVFSNKRFKIASVHDWVATTDIATYFDNVQYSHLRNILSTLDGTEEVILDILFSVLDQLCWRPDYLPSAFIGLPQVQFDAPRLLAHIYLFEIDSYLKRRIQNNFVRWVDDITFAADTKEECKLALRDLDTLLQMRGVRLNSGKTHILSAVQARKFFHQRMNENLDRWKKSLDAEIEQGLSTASTIRKISKSFKIFTEKTPHGHSDKVVKRFIGLAATVKSEFALSYCIQKFESAPELRDTIYWYFSALGPNPRILTCLENYLKGGSALDDASQCQIGKLLTDWEVDPATLIFIRLQSLAKIMATEDFVGNDTYRFISALWMMTKYSDHTGITNFIGNTRKVWENSEFLSRQVAAASGKFRGETWIDWFSQEIKRHSLRSPLAVLNSLNQLRSYKQSVPANVRMYILNGNQKSTYTLQRFLIAFTVLSSPKLNKIARDKLRNDLQKILVDPHYRKVIEMLP